MRVGMHVNQQKAVIRFMQDTLRKQFWAMVCLAVLLAFLGGALAVWPRVPPEKLAVALVQTPTSTGSGFLVSNLLVVTTARVVGTHSQVFLVFPEKSPVTGRVLFADVASDVALIEAAPPDSQLKPLALGDFDAVTEGEDLYIVGYPGEIYYKTPAALQKKSQGVFETNAMSNPGNSGAPVIRKTDEAVVGMVLSTRELGGQGNTGRHRAIPINLIAQICRDRQYPIR